MYVLHYDSSCPVCVSFAKMISAKTSRDKLSLVGVPGATEFRLVTPAGKILLGKEVVETLSNTFPEIKDYFWMLPETLRGTAVKAASVAGSIVRKTTRMFGKSCNCGK